MNAPIISFHSGVNPYNSISQTLLYSETVVTKAGLPVLNGDDSDPIVLRVYNNFSLSPQSNIATAYDIQITTYDDGIYLGASTPPVSGQWLYIRENGYGENSNIPGLYSSYNGDDIAVGGSQNMMIPPVGSDGTQNSYIRAGSANAGVGFLELVTYLSVPLSASSNNYNFVVGIQFLWNT